MLYQWFKYYFPRENSCLKKSKIPKLSEIDPVSVKLLIVKQAIKLEN